MRDQSKSFEVSICMLLYLKELVYKFMSANQEQKVPKSKKSKTIATFQLGKTIGKGTFATVKQATHIPSNQKVAIKILPKKLIVDQRDKTNISRQLSILKKLRHPNIAQLFQIIQTNSKIYIVMEHVQGGELYQMIVNSKTNKLTQEKASGYFQQLINTVEYLHSLGVAHRDLKPQNILITQDDTIKLIDFGLSSLYYSEEKLKTPCGSPCYAAPEMLSQRQYCPLKTDLWSCGIVLYTMLCGFLPFEHDSTAQLYRMIQKGTYQQPVHLSSNAKSILKLLLQPNPSNRPSFKKIRKHQFCRMHEQPITKGLLPSEKICVDSQIVQEMKDMRYHGFINDVQGNLCNQNTTAYYLLLFRKLRKERISRLRYFQKVVEVKTPFKSKSILIKRYENPEQLPQINKKNIVSLANLAIIRKQRSRTKTHMSVNILKEPSRSTNLRIKRIKY